MGKTKYLEVSMESFINWIMPKILLMLAPLVRWFDHTFTIPFSVKIITADHYFAWRSKLQRGMVFVSDTYGQGSNIINPSKGKHGAVYFGTGLKTYLISLVALKGDSLGDHFFKYFNAHIESISDDVEYVIEAVGKGVIATSVIKFLTTKDVILGFYPKFCDSEGMITASKNANLDLGLPYDYAFNRDDEAKYCFELVVDAFLKENPHLNFVMEEYLGYDVYLSTAFKDEKMWTRVIDSKKEFPDLYKED